MKKESAVQESDSHRRVEATYIREKPRMMARMRSAGRSLEEAEDLLHDVYVDTIESLSVLDGIRNLSAWIYSSITRRMIDLWRHERVRRSSGETDIAEELLCEIIAGAGLDPLEGYVRSSLIDALNDAIRVLPTEQRRVIEAQVFGGQTFQSMARTMGVSVDTLKARKRYAVKNLSRALRHWINE